MPTAVLESPDTLSYSDALPVDAAVRAAPDAQLVLALHSQSPLAPAARISIGDAHEVAIGRGHRAAIHHRWESSSHRLYVAVPDSWMSSTHARLVRGHGWWMIEDADSKNGTRVNGTAVSRLPLSNGDVIETGGTFFLFHGDSPRLAGEPAYASSDDLGGEAAAMATLNLGLARQLDGVRRIAGSNIPVIVVGETGTGKEMTVRALHQMSGRTGDLVAVNCGAIPESLIEAELFGHERGAYSGANESREGLIRAANGGTLFLDEVAELPEASQAALLRFLQEGELRPLGSATSHRVDTRVIAATHQHLPDLVRRGQFRRDLFARLAGYRVELPPLRERREDLGMLIACALRELAGESAAEICIRPSAARALFEYDYPLNIRELRHALQAALALCDGKTIAREHLPESIARPSAADVPKLSVKDQRLRDEVSKLLELHRGNVSAVAREMGRAPVQIRRWCRRFDLDLDQYRRAER